MTWVTASASKAGRNFDDRGVASAADWRTRKALTDLDTTASAEPTETTLAVVRLSSSSRKHETFARLRDTSAHDRGEVAGAATLRGLQLRPAAGCRARPTGLF